MKVFFIPTPPPLPDQPLLHTTLTCDGDKEDDKREQRLSHEVVTPVGKVPFTPTTAVSGVFTPKNEQRPKSIAEDHS